MLQSMQRAMLHASNSQGMHLNWSQATLPKSVPAVHQVAAELQALDISSTAIKAIFDVIQLSDVADLSSLLGEDSKVRGSGSRHRVRTVTHQPCGAKQQLLALATCGSVRGTCILLVSCACRMYASKFRCCDPLQVAEELQQLFRLLKAYGCGDWIVFDASIMRGLAYYTGGCAAAGQPTASRHVWHAASERAAVADADTASMCMWIFWWSTPCPAVHQQYAAAHAQAWCLRRLTGRGSCARLRAAGGTTSCWPPLAARLSRAPASALATPSSWSCCRTSSWCRTCHTRCALRFSHRPAQAL